MDEAEVLAVLADLEEAGCPAWVAGGWGVDALAGRCTRHHRDLDVLVAAEHETRALDVLGRRGYAVETDQRPVRVELRSGERYVDVHPVRFEPHGDGYQAGPAGTWFYYERECLVTGTIGGHVVRCVSAARQLHAHSGYPARDVDRADLQVLRTLRADSG